MCDPATAIGVLSSVAGGAVNAKIQNNAISEQNRQNEIAMAMERDARIREEARQLEFEKAQAEQVAKALEVAAPVSVADKVVEMVADPENPIVKAVDSYKPIDITPNIKNRNVDAAIGDIVGKSLDRTQKILGAQSKLSGQGVTLQSVQDALMRMGSEISTTASNRRASSGVAGLETTIPGAKITPSKSIFGDVLLLGGQGLAGVGGKRRGRASVDIGGVFK